MCTWYHHLPVSHVASASRQSDPHYCFCYRTELRRRERGASYAWSHSIVSSSAFSGWRSRCWNLCAQQNRSDVAHQAPPTREYLPIQRYALPRKVSTSMDSPKSSPNAAGGRRQRPRGRGTGRRTARGGVRRGAESDFGGQSGKNDAQKRAAGHSEAATAARRPVLGAWRCLRWYW